MAILDAESAPEAFSGAGGCQSAGADPKARRTALGELGLAIMFARLDVAVALKDVSERLKVERDPFVIPSLQHIHQRLERALENLLDAAEEAETTAKELGEPDLDHTTGLNDA